MSINSSKVYCKLSSSVLAFNFSCVLIVAKCIVNRPDLSPYIPFSKGINSSKVYCKFFTEGILHGHVFVLIVAKCIVNLELKIFC